MQTLGFTIIECLLTLALIAMLVTGAVYSQHNLTQRRLVEDTVSQWIHSLQFARNYALLTGQTTTICPSHSGQCDSQDYTKGWLIFVDRRLGDQAYRDSNETILALAPPLDSRIRFVTNIQQPIRFLANGRTNANGHFVVCIASALSFVSGIFLIHSGRIRQAGEEELTQCA